MRLFRSKGRPWGAWLFLLLFFACDRFGAPSDSNSKSQAIAFSNQYPFVDSGEIQRGDESDDSDVLPTLGDHGLPVPDPMLIRAQFMGPNEFLISGEGSYTNAFMEMEIETFGNTSSTGSPSLNRKCVTVTDANGNFECRIYGLPSERALLRRKSSPQSTAIEFFLQWDGSFLAMGNKIEPLGDFNRDGKPDFLLGTSDGLHLLSLSDNQFEKLGWFEGSKDSPSFGEKVFVIPDLTLDGQPELLLSEPGFSKEGHGIVGRLLIYDLSRCSLGRCSELLYEWIGDEVDAGFGENLALIQKTGDQNRILLVVGSSRSKGELGEKEAGRIQFFEINSKGFNRCGQRFGKYSDDAFGRILRGGFDLNGDGLSDVLVSSKKTDSDQNIQEHCLAGGGDCPKNWDPTDIHQWTGQIEVYSGDFCRGFKQPILTKEGEKIGDNFGYRVRWADLSKDGIPELVVAVPKFGKIANGAPYLSGLSLSPGLITASEFFRIPLGPSEESFGHSIHLDTDFDGDGFADIAVAKPLQTTMHGPRSGGITFYSGSCASLTPNSSCAKKIHSISGLGSEMYFGSWIRGMGENPSTQGKVIVGAYPPLFGVASTGLLLFVKDLALRVY